jgi:hypothetical protein
MSSRQLDPATVLSAFRQVREVLVPWDDMQAGTARAALLTLERHLGELPPASTFPGMEAFDGDRQSFWVATTGLDSPLHTTVDSIAGLDGNVEDGRLGLQMLARTEVKEAVVVLKEHLDASLRLGGEVLDLGTDLLDQVSIRYRAIRYQIVQRPDSGVGLHPDGSLLSALITMGDGLEIWTDSGVRRPNQDGIILMPGTILYRWSHGSYRPTFHRVRLVRTPDMSVVKVSIVALLNFPDNCVVPRSRSLGHTGSFLNRVQHFKEDDMALDGDLAPLWRELGLTTTTLPRGF